MNIEEYEENVKIYLSKMGKNINDLKCNEFMLRTGVINYMHKILIQYGKNTNNSDDIKDAMKLNKKLYAQLIEKIKS